MGNTERIRHNQVSTKRQWTLVQKTVETWFQPYRTSTSPDSAISVCAFKTYRDTAIWESETRQKCDRLMAIRYGHKVPLGLDSLQVPDQRVEIINHTKMTPDLDNDTTNFSVIASAIQGAYEKLQQELESIPPEYVPKEAPQDSNLDMTLLQQKGPQPRTSKRKMKNDPKEIDRKKYEDKWTRLQETAEDLEIWISEVLWEHTLAVDDWLRDKMEEWNAASIDNALLRECGDLDPSLYIMAQLSRKELLKRAFLWQLNDLDPQKDLLRTFAKSKSTFTVRDSDPGFEYTLRNWCRKLAGEPEKILGTIVTVNQAIRTLKQILPDTMLSEWDASDTSTEELEGFLKKLQEEAASLANTDVIDALNAKLKETQARMIREKKEAAEKETMARAKARQSVKDRAVPTSTRKTNPFGFFLRNFSMKDIEPLSTRQMTAEETQLEWTRPTETVIKSTLYKPPKEFKASYDRPHARTLQYYLKRFEKEAKHESELYRQRQELLEQHSRAASERRSKEQEAIRMANKLFSTTESKSAVEIKRIIEETWGTTLPETAPLLEQPVWHPAEYTKDNTRPRAWNFIHQPRSKITEILNGSNQDAGFIAKQDIEQVPTGSSDVDSDVQSRSESPNFTITSATTPSEASDAAKDEDLLNATSEHSVLYQRQRSKSIPDFRPDYMEDHLHGFSLAKAIMKEGTVDDGSVKDTQTYVAQTPFAWPDEASRDAQSGAKTDTVQIDVA